MSRAEVFKGRKNWKSDIAKTNYSTLKDYQSKAIIWRSNAIKMEDARFGKQFSNAERKELLAFRQAPLPINISAAICDTADAMMLSAKPTIHVAPIIHPYDKAYSEMSKKVAGIYKFLLKKSWYDSLGALQFDRVVSDSTNVGHGLMYAVPRSEYGEFTVDIKHLSWRYYFPDPSSRDPLYRDSDAMIYAMPISHKSAYKFVKSIEPNLSYDDFKENFVDGSYSVDFSFDEDTTYPFDRTKEVLFIQLLTIEDEINYVIIPKTEKANTGEIEYEFKTVQSITPELQEAERQGIISIKKEKSMSLVEYTSIGNYGYKIVYPISQYNIVPFVYDHRDKPYPYSRMWSLYPLQRSLNKFIMSAILNASILNSVKVIAEEDSIVNLKEWTMNASMPGAILRYRMPVPGHSKPPSIIQPQPMHEAWLSMPRYLTAMMEYVSGIFSTMQGNPEGAPNVFSTVASLQSAGGLKIKRRLARMDASLSVLGSVVADFYKEYSPVNAYAVNFVDGENDEIVKYNSLKVKEDKSTGQMKVGIDPSEDLRRGYKKVRFTSSGSNGYEASTEAALLTTLATQLSLPDLVPAILERINVTGLEDLGKNIKDNQNAQRENEQLKEMVKQLDGKAKQYQNQITQIAVRLEQAKAKGRFDVELQQFKDNPEGYLNKASNLQGDR